MAEVLPKKYKIRLHRYTATQYLEPVTYEHCTDLSILSDSRVTFVTSTGKLVRTNIPYIIEEE